MNRKAVKYVLLTLAFHAVACSIAVAETRIAYIELPQVLEQGNDFAPYNKLMFKVLARIKEPHQSLFLPSARANAALNEQQIDCIFPVVTNGYMRRVNTAYSIPVNQVTAHFFTVNNAKLELSNEAELLVVYQRGIFYGQLFEQYPRVNFVPVEDAETALRILEIKRADAYLAYYPDILLSVLPERYASLSLTKSEPLFATQDRLECVTNDRGKRLIEQFNQAILDMKNSGELQKLLGNYNNN